jgi:hypothetical protein
LHNDGWVVEETLEAQAYERVNATGEESNSNVQLALATASSELFAVCGGATDEITDAGGATE